MGRVGTVLAGIVGGIIRVLSVPVGLLNIGAGIVGGIWLLTLGNRALVVLGLLAMFIAPRGLGLAGLLQYIFSGPGALAVRRGWYAIGGIGLLLGTLYAYALITVWCVGSFSVVFQSYYDGGSVWPYLLWCYGIAAGPWRFMAGFGGGDSIASNLAAFGACIGTIAMMGVVLLKAQATLIDIVIGFSTPLSIIVLIQSSLVLLTMREAARGS